MSGQVPYRRGYSRGTQVTIISGRYKGQKAIIDSNVFQGSVDHPRQPDHAFHVTIPGAKGEIWPTVRWDQVCKVV